MNTLTKISIAVGVIGTGVAIFLNWEKIKSKFAKKEGKDLGEKKNVERIPADANVINFAPDAETIKRLHRPTTRQGQPTPTTRRTPAGGSQARSHEKSITLSSRMRGKGRRNKTQTTFGTRPRPARTGSTKRGPLKRRR